MNTPGKILSGTLGALAGGALVLSLNASGTVPAPVATERPLLSPLFSPQTLEALHLTPRQQALLAQVRSANARTLTQIKRQLAGVRAVLDAELTKDQPDLHRVAERAAEARRLIFEAWRRGGEARLGLYDALTPTQKTQVRDVIKEKLARFDRLRALLVRLLDGPET